MKEVTNYKTLKEVYYFISSVFYEETVINKEEYYYSMEERYNEMVDQYRKCHDFIFYIEENSKIVAAITGKNQEKDKITISLLAVSRHHRRLGLGRTLMLEFEKRCLQHNITKIDLGGRLRACPFYLSLDYKPTLMLQVKDNVTIAKIKEIKSNLELIYEDQTDTNGIVMYKVDGVNESDYLRYKTIPNIYISYYFKKEIGEKNGINEYEGKF